jgi:toxin CcdB
VRLSVHRVIRSGVIVVDVQSTMLSYLPTRLVVPLIAEDQVRKVARLNPSFTLFERTWLLAPQLAATAIVRELGEPIASLEHEHDAILAAMDMLLTGI